MSTIPVALQLYTVRDLTQRDFAGTVREVAKLGYAGVELAGTGGLAASDLKELLAETGLKVAGSHIGLDVLEGNLSGAIELNLEIGNRWIVCPYLPEDRRKSEADWRAIADFFNKIGAECKQHGVQFCYHNHAFEFEKVDDQYALDLLYGNTDPDLVKAELDTYWVLYGGADPAGYLRRLSGRCPLVHLKDMEEGDRSFAEVGTGVLPLDAIVDAAKAGGTHWLIVEQDVCKRPTLESARISIENLKARGLA
jgi:sugar phosphate isomerase/epimerase